MSEHQSYCPTLYPALVAAEDRHFWFRARNRVIAELVKQITAGLHEGYGVLEVGCGTGNVLRVLEQACPSGVVVGMDLFSEGLQYARKRTSCALVQGDINLPPFDRQFDLIGAFDLLEHVSEDEQVLRNLHRMLAPGGTLLLTGPAHMSLWSYFDVLSHHCRRYEAQELETKLVSAGYRVEYVTEYMASLYPLVWLGRWLVGRENRRDSANAERRRKLLFRELRIIPLVNGLLTWLLSREVPIIARRGKITIGTSLLAIARKDGKATT
jgi:SAM-dependent methyltransferase